MINKTKDRVAILMSTYNGEKYLEEQIKSIINQSFSNWHLYIRDDGSTDSTSKIIDNYSKNSAKITFINKESIDNRGVVGSFMTLLEYANADYYMFSDQDDVWKKDKIKHTLVEMKKYDLANIPICVHTDLQVVDENLNGKESMKKGYVWSSFPHIMFGNCVTGCTMMINQSLKNKIKFHTQNLSLIYLHDWWIALVAAAFGKVIFLDEKTILYRQHTDNVIGSNKKNDIFHIIGRFFDQKTDEENMLDVIGMSYEFDRLYKNDLNEEQYKLIHSYAQVLNKSTPFFNLKTILIAPPKRLKLQGNIFFAFLMIKDYKKIQNRAKILN